MNQNVLISTALVCSLWDNHRKDTLDLMMPFLKYVIAKKTSIGEELDLGTITTMFKEEFGYETIPQNVIVSMLNRLSPEVLSKKQNRYTLIASLDQELADFEKRHTTYKEHRNEVGSALSCYLNENVSNPRTAYTSETALLALIGFFVGHGLVVAQSPEQLSLIRKNTDDKTDYTIARFIIAEHKKESVIFDYLLNMVKGFFVSTAISFQPENLTLPHSKFKSLCCYLDTRVIIDALGLRLQSGQKAALELLEMLRSEQATVCCFEHTVDELREIIKAYRNTLMRTGKRNVYNTLEHWDEQNYSVEQVNRYLALLDKKIEALHIKIVKSPAKMETRIRGLKVEKFKKELNTCVPYHSDAAYKNDVLSIMGVMKLRNGHTSTELEKCEHIFITTNIPLIGVVGSCLKDSSENVPPVMSDITMSSIVWFKCCSSHKDYPRYKLIENALLALEPSNSLLKEFYSEIDRLMAENGITEEEAAIIRTDIQIKREMAVAVNGDVALVNKNIVQQMKERLRDRYIGENKQQTEESYQQYLKQKAQNEQALREIAAKIEACGNEKRNSATKRLNIVAYTSLIALLITLIGFVIASFVIDQNFWIGAFVVLALDIIGVYGLLCDKKHYIREIICRIANNYADKAMELKREEYSSIISTLTSTKE